MILPDGGRSYLSKIYSDAWMTEYGFLERTGEVSVGDVLVRKHDDTIPALVTVRSDQSVREAVSVARYVDGEVSLLVNGKGEIARRDPWPRSELR